MPSPVEYLEPMAGNKEEALGLDAGGETVRFISVARARDSGQLTASGRVTIGAVTTPPMPLVSPCVLPLYRNGMPQETVPQRRQAMLGLIMTSAYRMNHLMQGVLSEPLLRQIRIRIHDAGSPGDPRSLARQLRMMNLLFDSGLQTAKSMKSTLNGASVEGSQFTKAMSLDVGGRRWNLYFSAKPEFVGASSRLLQA